MLTKNLFLTQAQYLRLQMITTLLRKIQQAFYGVGDCKIKCCRVHAVKFQAETTIDEKSG